MQTTLCGIAVTDERSVVATVVAAVCRREELRASSRAHAVGDDDLERGEAVDHNSLEVVRLIADFLEVGDERGEVLDVRRLRAVDLVQAILEYENDRFWRGRGERTLAHTSISVKEDSWG